jgi:formamidopyrimidine-DNA glycosylase
MPELPEVETVVRGLRRRISGLEFSGVEVCLGKCLQGSRQALSEGIRGKKVHAVVRRGKNIVVALGGGEILRVHLGMTGRLRVVAGDSPREKHTHFIFSFLRHPFQLRYVDSRRFGRVAMEKKGGESSLCRLGPEPLEIPATDFVLRARSRRREIKPLLLDQHFLAGVGNIYADESLHRAGIHPRRRAHTLPGKTLRRLWGFLREILRESIRAGGSSVRSYVNSAGAAGGFQHFLRVYGREGEPCGACGRKIVRETVGGRSSFYCPRCQPGPVPRGRARLSRRGAGK